MWRFLCIRYEMKYLHFETKERYLGHENFLRHWNDMLLSYYVSFQFIRHFILSHGSSSVRRLKTSAYPLIQCSCREHFTFGAGVEIWCELHVHKLMFYRNLAIDAKQKVIIGEINHQLASFMLVPMHYNLAILSMFWNHNLSCNLLYNW